MMQGDGEIWALLGARAGDNAQVLALSHAVANETGMSVLERPLHFTRAHLLPNVLRGASLGSIVAQDRALIAPPWPTLVVAAGRRTAPVAQWIKRQSPTTRIVHIGRPRLPLDRFDLVVSTPQYGLPQLENTVQTTLPMVPASHSKKTEIEAFKVLWNSLPKPHIAVHLGGAKFPLRFSRREEGILAQLLNAHVSALSGSAILIDSPRTPPGLLQRISHLLKVPQWINDPAINNNPYRASLALADQIIVTSDSVSMVSDALAIGKPTWLFALPKSPFAITWSTEWGLPRTLAMSGILSPPRDVDHLMQWLLQKGFVGNLKTATAPHAALDLAAERSALVRRIVALL